MALEVLRSSRQRISERLLLIYLEAVILATSPDSEVRDGDLAMPLAQRAARLTSYQDPAALLALAAAVAETGDLGAATRLLDLAKALCRSGRKPEFLPTLEAASRQLQARGVVRWDAEDWRRLPL